MPRPSHDRQRRPVRALALALTGAARRLQLEQPCARDLGVFVNLQNRRQLGRYVKTRIFLSEMLVAGLEADATATFVRDPDGFDAGGYGDAWLRGGESCVLRVPSRVVPEEASYLVNPLHPDFGGSQQRQNLTSPPRTFWREARKMF